MEPSIADFTYGDHNREVLDICPADSACPTPLTPSIHGGGSTRGGKRYGYQRRLEQFLGVWIPVAAINDRLVGQVPLPAGRCDAARALQILRPIAKERILAKRQVGSSVGLRARSFICGRPTKTNRRIPQASIRSRASRLGCGA